MDEINAETTLNGWYLFTHTDSSCRRIIYVLWNMIRFRFHHIISLSQHYKMHTFQVIQCIHYFNFASKRFALQDRLTFITCFDSLIPCIFNKQHTIQCLSLKQLLAFNKNHFEIIPSKRNLPQQILDVIRYVVHFERRHNKSKPFPLTSMQI